MPCFALLASGAASGAARIQPEPPWDPTPSTTASPQAPPAVASMASALCLSSCTPAAPAFRLEMQEHASASGGRNLALPPISALLSLLRQPSRSPTACRHVAPSPLTNARPTPSCSGATALRRAAARAPLAVRANASVKPPQASLAGVAGCLFEGHGHQHQHKQPSSPAVPCMPPRRPRSNAAAIRASPPPPKRARPAPLLRNRA